MSNLRSSLTGPPGAPLLLLLHGFLGSRRDWDPVAEALADRFRCCAVDLPGHGETGDPGDDTLWGIEGCAAGLLKLLAELAAGRAAVAGYSLGGRIALHLAARAPEHVSRVIAASASPGLADAAARAARRDDDERLARRLEEEGLERFLDSWYRQPLFATLREHPRFGEILERRGRNDASLLAHSLRSAGLGSQRSLWEALPGLPVPLLLLAGERDEKFCAIGRAMAERCPGAALRLLPGRGHALVEEDPAAVAAEIARFCAGLTLVERRAPAYHEPKANRDGTEF